MGRGRAKAKQTKVARELKYSSPGMDLDRLNRDLHSDRDPGSPAVPTVTVEDPEWADDEDDEDSAAS
jgi:hypothetical protein